MLGEWRSDACYSTQTVGAGRLSVGTAEDSAEVRGIGKAPPDGNGSDGPVGKNGIAEVPPAVFQPPCPDPGGDSGIGIVEDVVQLAGGNVVGSRDVRRSEAWIAQVGFDVLPDADQQFAVASFLGASSGAEFIVEHGGD